MTWCHNSSALIASLSIINFWVLVNIVHSIIQVGPITQFDVTEQKWYWPSLSGSCKNYEWYTCEGLVLWLQILYCISMFRTPGRLEAHPELGYLLKFTDAYSLLQPGIRQISSLTSGRMETLYAEGQNWYDSHSIWIWLCKSTVCWNQPPCSFMLSQVWNWMCSSMREVVHFFFFPVYSICVVFRFLFCDEPK